MRNDGDCRTRADIHHAGQLRYHRRRNPIAGLLQATDGNLYGTTGGTCSSNGCGTIFKITPSGTLTTLYTFCSQSGCPDGDDPTAGLVQAADGALYGTTNRGGANGNYGTIFKITSSGALTTLYSFCSQSSCTDGKSPYLGGLVQAADGNLYGTTSLAAPGTSGRSSRSRRLAR